MLSVKVWAFEEQQDLQKSLTHKEAGDLFLKQNQTTEAIQEYRAAIEFNPHSTSAYFNLAIAYFLERNLLEAITALKTLVQLDPKDVEAWYNLGSLELYEGKLEEAALYFEKARSHCDRNPSFIPLIDQALEYIKELSPLNPNLRALALFTLQSENNLTPVSLTL